MAHGADHERSTEIAFDLTFDLVRRIRLDDGRLSHEYVSSSFLTVLGHETASLLGDCHRLVQLFPQQILGRLETLAKAVRDGKVVTGTVVEYPFLHADGREVFFEHRLCIDPQDPRARVTVISRDISERRERVRLAEELALAKVREERLRADAYRMINHTSKRVLSNTVAMCDILREKLDLAGFEDSADDVAKGIDVRSLLASSKAESIAGINLSSSALVHANVLGGRHTSTSEVFTMHELFDRLGWSDHARFRIHPKDCFQLCIRADASALQAILFNAGMNALQHGAQRGVVDVSTHMQPADSSESDATSKGTTRCHITIRSLAGSNHASLAATVGENMDVIEHLASNPVSRAIVGGKGSTFCGLSDIQTIVQTIFTASTTVGLYCRGDHVVFELACPVERVVEPAEACSEADGVALGAPCAAQAHSLSPDLVVPERASEPPAMLPSGLVWVCVDDDDIPRLLAQQAFALASADMRRSRVLGETYDEAASVVDQMVHFSNEVGSDKLVLCLDQHMDYDEGSFRGTEVCAALRARHAFDGVIVILSANDDDQSKAEYQAAGVDASIGKGVAAKGKSLAESLVEVVARAYAARATSRAWGNAARAPATSKCARVQPGP